MASDWIEGVIVAGFLATVLRSLGAVAREHFNIAFEFAGWILCALGAWVVAAVAGAGVPLWIILVLGVGGGFAGRIGGYWWLQSGADVIFVLVVLVVSRSPVDLNIALLTLALYVLAGCIFDAIAGHISKLLAAVILIIPIALLGFKLSRGSGPLVSELWARDKTFVLYASVSVPDAGKPIKLDEENIAWILRPGGDSPKGGALLLHGADAAGSHQRAAVVLQRALLQSGYEVVSLDHPGYGVNPHPKKGESVTAWNPLPTVQSAYNMMDDGLPEGLPRIVVGHSMGTSDVLRLLGAGVTPSFAVIMGGAMPDPPGRDNYWYYRFHRDRGIEWRLSKEKWESIHQLYYNNRTLVHKLEEDHSPILFIQFGIEWSNIRSLRSELWEVVPRSKRQICLGATTHYLNSFYFRLPFVSPWFDGKLIVGDTRSISRMQKLLSTEMETLHQ